jgi:hypothetical protein
MRLVGELTDEEGNAGRTANLSRNLADIASGREEPD